MRAKCAKTVGRATSAASATSDTDTASNPRSKNIAVATSEIRALTSAFFRSRRPCCSMTQTILDKKMY